MLKILGRFFFRFILASLVLISIHWALIYFTFLALPREALFGLHLFIAVLTLVSFTGVVLVWKFRYNMVGFGFLGISLLKMMASFLYLLPEISTEDSDTNNYVLHFFAVYFIYLFIEALAVMKLLRQGSAPGSSEKE